MSAKEIILGILQCIMMFILLMMFVLFLYIIITCFEPDRRDESEKIEYYSNKITTTLKENSFEYESIDYSDLYFDDIVWIHVSDYNEEYEQIYNFLQPFDHYSFIEIILVTSEGNEYKVDERELLENDKTVWEKPIPDNENPRYEKYFKEGLCSKWDCDDEPYEDKYYCTRHCCHAEGCKSSNNSNLYGYCEAHNCDYPACANSNAVRHHGDGKYCRIHIGKPLPKQEHWYR